MINYKCSLCDSCFQMKSKTTRELCDICLKESKKGIFKRNCPKCNDEIVYVYKVSFLNASKKNTNCQKCYSSWNKINKEVRDGIRKNGFSGKTHSDVQKEKWSIKRVLNCDKYQTESFKNKISILTKGTNNPMHGKNFYSIWLEKYGKEEADIRLLEHSKKVSRPGKLNGMYGKPSPNGSGNGWSGWYDGWFFRSLKELYFMINTIEKNNLQWESGEKSVFTITWELDGKSKTYHSDFIIGNKMIEIKPKSLWNSAIVKSKREAAEKWCFEKGMVYELIDTPSFELSEIQSLIDSGLLKFTERYEKKYQELVLNKG